MQSKLVSTFKIPKSRLFSTNSQTPLGKTPNNPAIVHIHPEWSIYIYNAITRQCIRFKIFIISETGQHVDKCPHGPSFQRMSPFILWICIPAQPWVRLCMTQLNTILFPQSPTSSPLPLHLLLSLLCSLLQMFILKICFSLGLIQGLHLQFSFTKQKNILLERNGIKEKCFSVCPEAGHRQDLICYVQLESGLIRGEERGCLIKFTFHFLTWHQSPVTHGTDGDPANNFHHNLVGETLGNEKTEGREEDKDSLACFHLVVLGWEQIHDVWKS